MKKFLAVTFVALFAVSAFAADFNLYGSMRFKTFYVNQDSDFTGTKSDTDLREVGLQGNSRVGAKIKVNDKFTGHLELAVKGNSGNNDVTTRLFYGTYDFGGVKLSVGQLWNPLNVLTIDQVSKNDADLLGWGAFLTNRNEAIMIEAAGARLAIVRPKSVPDLSTNDLMLPRFEADYTLKVDPVKARVFAGYQTVSGDNATNFDIDSYVVGLDLTGDMAGVGLALTGYYGSNTGAMGAAGPNLPATKSEDTTDYGVAAQLSYKVADNLKFALGYGYASSDRDDVKDPDTQQSYFVNVKYTVAKGFFIQPEVAVFDKMDNSNGVKQGKEVYYGAKWQMNF